MGENTEIDLEKELEWDSFDKMRFVLRMEEETGRCMDDVLIEVVKAKNLKKVAESVANAVAVPTWRCRTYSANYLPNS